MRAFLTVLLIAGAIYGARELFNYYESIQRAQYRREGVEPAAKPSAPAPYVPPGFRAGFEPQLESTLAEATKQGAPGIRRWLQQYRLYVSDPRLANIELDLILLLGPENRVEARKILGEIGARLPPGTPVYTRFQTIAKIYQ